jgi:hypothetical protein
LKKPRCKYQLSQRVLHRVKRGHPSFAVELRSFGGVDHNQPLSLVLKKTGSGLPVLATLSTHFGAEHHHADDTDEATSLCKPKSQSSKMNASVLWAIADANERGINERHVRRNGLVGLGTLLPYTEVHLFLTR